MRGSVNLWIRGSHKTGNTYDYDARPTFFRIYSKKTASTSASTSSSIGSRSCCHIPHGTASLSATTQATCASYPYCGSSSSSSGIIRIYTSDGELHSITAFSPQ